MAKRGYRGKAPLNNCIIPTKAAKDKYNSKLMTEYNKTNPKLKYEYIRNHYFHPQASAVVICHADIDTNEEITLISTRGTSKTYIAKTGNSFGSNHFKANVAAGATATNLKDAIEHASGHNGELLVEIDSATLTITQRDPGPDGNTTIANDFDSAATVPAAFTGG